MNSLEHKLIRGDSEPFKTSRRRKFAQLLVEGKISDEVYEEWNRETGGKLLPERVTPKGTTRKKSARKK